MRDQFFTFSLGDVGVVITLLTVLWKGQKWFLGVQKWLDMHEIEHNILLADYCDRHGIDINELPTRQRQRRR